MIIRRARKNDEDAVGRMWIDLLHSQGEMDDRFAPSDDARQRWKNDFPAWLDSLSRRIFVAEEDGEIRGFVTAEQWVPPPVYQDEPGVYVNELYVDPAHRRTGTGRRLVQAVRDWAEDIGVGQIRTGVLDGNEEAVAFWRKIGGEPVARTFSITLEAESSDEKTGGTLGFRL